VGGISISNRHLNNLTTKVGSEMEADRDKRTAAYFEQPLPRTPCEPETPIALACVSIDGGRMQTRLDGGGRGVHDPHWRETKNALFLRMNDVSSEKDPHPELPACFRDRRRMKKLLPGVETLDDDLQQASQEAANLRPPKKTVASGISISHLYQFVGHERSVRPDDGGRSRLSRFLSRYESGFCLRRLAV
jgi:hypothetical protein